MGIILIVLVIILIVVWWKLSNRRTRAIYLAGLTPEERAAHLAEERIKELAKSQARREPISSQELITAGRVVRRLGDPAYLLARAMWGARALLHPRTKVHPPHHTNR